MAKRWQEQHTAGIAHRKAALDSARRVRPIVSELLADPNSSDTAIKWRNGRLLVDNCTDAR